MYSGIALGGKAGAGKNALAEHLSNLLLLKGAWPTQLAFGDALKVQLYNTYGLRKEDDGGREALIRLGDAERARDADVFVKRLAQTVDSVTRHGATPLITDVRYENELLWCVSAGMFCVYVQASSIDRGYALVQRGEDPSFALSSHPTENEVCESGSWHLRIWNPHGFASQPLSLLANQVLGEARCF